VLSNPALKTSRKTVSIAASLALAAMVATSGAPEAARAQPPAPPRSGSLGPLMAETLAPWLADWIVQSRDAAVAQGVAPIPPHVRAALTGYVPEAILDRVRWRAGAAGELTVQQNIFALEEAPAVTLDYVVVFANDEVASDPKLWAHEIWHVMQYADWGVREFALRYLQHYEAVENEAAEFRWQWMKEKGLTPTPGSAE
jgi:uncharacterized protein DUF4157